MVFRTLALIVGLFMAGLTSQAPEFVQQYRQRLGGAIDELTRIIADFETDSGQLGITSDDALNRLQATGEPVAAQRAERLREIRTRLASLRRQQAEMADAGAFGRLYVFARDMDRPLAAGTADDFEFAMPLTFEGAVTALAGLGMGYAFVRLPLMVFRRRRKSDAPNRTNPARRNSRPVSPDREVPGPRLGRPDRYSPASRDGPATPSGR